MVVVGSGFAGSLLARFFAEDGHDILLIEKRNHIGGNMYDYRLDDGPIVQKYGPHTFHTNKEKVYRVLMRFCRMEDYRLKCSSVINGVETPVPFNFSTIDQFYPPIQADKLKRKLKKIYPKDTAYIFDLMENDNDEIREFASFLFEQDYKPYTAKQWGLNPNEVDSSILKRVPIRLNYDDNYYTDTYEGIPSGGFTKLFENILDHPHIKVKLNMDAMDHISFDDRNILFDGKKETVIYTGPIDALFCYKYGELPYRSLRFEFEKIDISSFQGAAVVAYPKAGNYTRITEYTKIPEQKSEHTVIAKEFPLEYRPDSSSEPYYPLLTEESIERYGRYYELSKHYSNLIICGRLAEYKYYNMDQVVERAIRIYEDYCIGKNPNNGINTVLA